MKALGAGDIRKWNKNQRDFQQKVTFLGIFQVFSQSSAIKRIEGKVKEGCLFDFRVKSIGGVWGPEEALVKS